MSWNEDKVTKLKELWGTHTASEISKIIGGVTRNAIIGKANRMNLSSKIKTRSVSQNSNFRNNTEENNPKQSYGRKSKFKSLIIEKDFEPENPKKLEELDETSCKWPIFIFNKFIVRYSMSTESHVNRKVNTLRQKWPKTESPSSRNKISKENTKNLSSIRRNNARSVSKRTSSSIRNSTSSGTRICSKLSKRTPKLSVLLGIDTPKRSKKTEGCLTRSCHLLSSTPQSCLTSRRCKAWWPSRKSKLLQFTF